MEPAAPSLTVTRPVTGGALRSIGLSGLAFAAATTWTVGLAEYILGPVGMYLTARAVYVRVRRLMPVRVDALSGGVTLKRGLWPARTLPVRGVTLQARRRGTSCVVETGRGPVIVVDRGDPAEARRMADWLVAQTGAALEISEPSRRPESDDAP